MARQVDTRTRRAATSGIHSASNLSAGAPSIAGASCSPRRHERAAGRQQHRLSIERLQRAPDLHRLTFLPTSSSTNPTPDGIPTAKSGSRIAKPFTAERSPPAAPESGLCLAVLTPHDGGFREMMREARRTWLKVSDMSRNGKAGLEPDGGWLDVNQRRRRAPADHRAGGGLGLGLRGGAGGRAELDGAMPANVEGGLALFVSALQGSLAAGSAAGGVIYEAVGPGGALAVAAAVAAAGSLALLGRAGAAISLLSAGSADLAREAARVAPAPSPGMTDRARSSAQRTR